MVFHISFYLLAAFLMLDAFRSYWLLFLLPVLLFALPQLFGRLTTGRWHFIHLVSKKVASYAFVLWIVISLAGHFNLFWLAAFNVCAWLVFVEEMSLYMILHDDIDDNLISILQIYV